MGGNMLKFLLAILICDNATDCRWVRMGHFISEEKCHEVGESYKQDETVQRYKCVMQLDEGGWRR
jgi:hypothetical protein